MSEIGIGLLFAFWFVLAYLLISKLFGAKELGQMRWRELLRPSADDGRLIGGKRPHLFLSTSEMSEHHSQANRGSSRAKDR
ncbi:MAG TPA: hypothetical protein VF735_11615 [Pyrinomonadaceae bacterium]|jgi:hypothetical protein